MDNNKGYSLVELMVVVAIIGILGTYATFNFSSGGAKLNQATRELFGNMQALKSEAVKRNAVGVVIFDVADDNYTMFVDSGPAGNNWSYDPPGPLVLNPITGEMEPTPPGDAMLSDNVTLPSPVQISEAVMINSDNTTSSFTTYGYSSRGLNKPIVTGDTRPHQIRLKIPPNGNTPAKYKGVTLSFAGNVRVITSDNGTSWQ